MPWPIQDQRPSLTWRRPDLEGDVGPDEAEPVRLQPAAPAQLQPHPAQREPRVVAVEHPVAAGEAQESQRAAVQRRRRRADTRPRAARRRGPCARPVLVLHHPRPHGRRPTLAERLLAGDKRALARGISLVEDDDPEGWELVREVYPHTGRASVVGFTGPPGAGSRR